ncbi:MAG: serine hydrolase [Acidobacteria bacterium]|nr:serine hydrolase [Acidobacteriota bacterium]
MAGSDASPSASLFPAARLALERAIAEGVCPGAVVEVGTATAPIWQEAFGRLSYDGPAVTLATVYDLASLTKVLATSALFMQRLERGEFGLDDAVAERLTTWARPDREAGSIADLLTHRSGLPAHRPFYQHLVGRRAFEAAIATSPLTARLRTRAVYSDLGFMVLGFLLDDGPGLAARFSTLLTQMRVVDDLQYLPPARWVPRIAPTEHDPWRGRLLVGEVHDENAYALGGVAGHAGLFGTGAAVGAYARHLLQVLDGRAGAFGRATLEAFITRDRAVPGSTRALGWDTMQPTSSCGTRLSARAFGHTGFTGTSLWIDPERNLYVVLLTNRVHPTRGGRHGATGIGLLRRALHDAVAHGPDAGATRVAP